MGGLLSFLGFNKKRKPSLTQNYQAPPSAMESPLWGTLSDFAKSRITGQGTGFGEDFLDRATNAPIKSREARFRDIELPELSSQLSARGLARSAGPNLATDVLTRAGQSKERDIQDLLAQFYYLNKVQQKQDVSEGVRTGENLQNTYLNQSNQIASQFNAAEAGNTARTAAVAQIDNANDRARQNQTLQAIPYAMNPIGGALLSLGGSSQGQIGTLLKKLGGGMQTFSQDATKVNRLGDDEVENFFKAYRAMKAMKGVK